MKNLKDYLLEAKNGKWALGQFNFSSFEQIEAIAKASARMKSPAIIAVSEGEGEYFGLEEAVALRDVLREKYGARIFLNLDHSKKAEWIDLGIKLMIDSIHFDGSALPLKENIKYSKTVVENARKRGILVEGELGAFGTSSEFHKGKAEIPKESLTNSEEAVEYCRETDVDLLAVAIGNIHGVYEQMPKLDFARLQEIEEAVSQILVLHGGSGFSEEDLEKAIEFGISKININTETRLVWRKSLDETLKADPSECKPHKILIKAQEAIQHIIAEKTKIFNSQNKI